MSVTTLMLPRLTPLLDEPGNYALINPPPKPKIWKRKGTFRFFDLPSEIRNRVYELALHIPDTISPTGVVDLHPQMPRLVARSLRLLRTCRQMYEEAYPIFYGRQTFRVFPTHPGYLNAKKPLLMQLPTKYRQTIQSLELRLGPGWGRPPKCQRLHSKLGLKDCTNVRYLKVFVECDPSHEIFKGFRIDDSFYTAFASGLLEGVLQQCLAIEVIEFDAYPSVKKRDALMTALLRMAYTSGKRITWGPERGWRKGDAEPAACELQGLEDALAVVTVH